MPQSPPDFPLLLLRTCELLLLLRLELQFAFLLALRSGADGGSRGGGSDGAGERGAGAGGVFEAVEVDGEMALLREAAVVDVPLLGAQGADEFFVVRDHDDAAFVVADGDGEAAEGVAV